MNYSCLFQQPNLNCTDSLVKLEIYCFPCYLLSVFQLLFLFLLPCHMKRRCTTFILSLSSSFSCFLVLSLRLSPVVADFALVWQLPLTGYGMTAPGVSWDYIASAHLSFTPACSPWAALSVSCLSGWEVQSDPTLWPFGQCLHFEQTFLHKRSFSLVWYSKELWAITVKTTTALCNVLKPLNTKDLCVGWHSASSLP